MVRAYIYLVSFKNTNDIYIGQTKCKHVFDRLKQHKRDNFCTIHLYVKHKLNNDWSNVSIDIIDNVEMDEDLTHLLNHPLNITIEYYSITYKKCTSTYKTQKELFNHKLNYLEHFLMSSLLILILLFFASSLCL